MLGSGTMTQVIKGPGRPLNSQTFNTPNCPLISQGNRIGLTPRLEKVNRSRRWFTPHHDNGVL
jgi:hypothetical protein